MLPQLLLEFFPWTSYPEIWAFWIYTSRGRMPSQYLLVWNWVFCWIFFWPAVRWPLSLNGTIRYVRIGYAESPTICSCCGKFGSILANGLHRKTLASYTEPGHPQTRSVNFKSLVQVACSWRLKKPLRLMKDARSSPTQLTVYGYHRWHQLHQETDNLAQRH